MVASNIVRLPWVVIVFAGAVARYTRVGRRRLTTSIEGVTNMKRLNAAQEQYVRDSLVYLCPEWVSDATLGNGVIVGLVSGLMAGTGWTFDETIKYLARLEHSLPDAIDIQRIPEAWREAWLANRIGVTT